MVLNTTLPLLETLYLMHSKMIFALLPHGHTTQVAQSLTYMTPQIFLNKVPNIHFQVHELALCMTAFHTIAPITKVIQSFLNSMLILLCITKPPNFVSSSKFISRLLIFGPRSLIKIRLDQSHDQSFRNSSNNVPPLDSSPFSSTYCLFSLIFT